MILLSIKATQDLQGVERAYPSYFIKHIKQLQAVLKNQEKKEVRLNQRFCNALMVVCGRSSSGKTTALYEPFVKSRIEDGTAMMIGGENHMWPADTKPNVVFVLVDEVNPHVFQERQSVLYYETLKKLTDQAIAKARCYRKTINIAPSIVYMTSNLKRPSRSEAVENLKVKWPEFGAEFKTREELDAAYIIVNLIVPSAVGNENEYRAFLNRVKAPDGIHDAFFDETITGDRSDIEKSIV